MWSRRSTDPLGKLLFEKYGLHVLGRPREDIAVFDVFPVEDGRASAAGPLTSLVGGDFELPEVREGERLTDVAGQTSDGVTGGVGLSFLEGALQLVGAGVWFGKLKAGLDHAGADRLAFRFGGASRNYVRDAFEFQLRLMRHPFDAERSPVRKGARYYVATAVHVSREIAIAVMDSRSNALDLSADLELVGGGRAGLEFNRDRELVATSDHPMIYGVELSELEFNARRGRVELAALKGFVQVRGSDGDDPSAAARSMIGSPDDSMLLELEG